MKKFIISPILLFAAWHIAHADEVIYKLAAPLPGGEETVSNFTDYAQFLFPFLLSIASILALVMFTLGAIQYMFSDGGSGNKEGKDKMTSAIMGILLAAGSVLLLGTINPELIVLKIDIPQRSGTTPIQNPPSCTTCGGSCYVQDCKFGRTCEPGRPGGNTDYSCVSGQTCRPKCPPAGDSSLTICSPTQADPNRCVTPGDAAKDRECTAAERPSDCPPDTLCVMRNEIVMGRRITIPLCLRQ